MNTTDTSPQVDAAPLALRAAIEDFLFLDAALLDEGRFDEWLELMDWEVQYLVPTTDRPDGHPEQDLFLIQDDYFLLSQRVGALSSGTNRAESPRATTQRMISNVRVTEAGEGKVDVAANFVVYRCRGGQVDVYPGRFSLQLRRDESTGFKFLRRSAVLALEELRPHGRVSFIL